MEHDWVLECFMPFLLEGVKLYIVVCFEGSVRFISCSKKEFSWDWEILVEQPITLNSVRYQLIVYRYCNADLIELWIFVLSRILCIISISESLWHIWFIIFYAMPEHFVQGMLDTARLPEPLLGSSEFLLLNQNYFYVNFMLFGFLPKNDVPPLL